MNDFLNLEVRINNLGVYQNLFLKFFIKLVILRILLYPLILTRILPIISLVIQFQF
jgi:hypothetical protein